MEKFEKFLVKSRKSNGEYLLPKTIEMYLFLLRDCFNDLEKIRKDEELVEFINKKVLQKNNNVLLSAFRRYLLFKGYDKNHTVFTKLKKPEKRANSNNSRRFLQSKVISRSELKLLFSEANDFEKLIISFLYDTACRRNEMTNVKVSDIKFVDNPSDNIYAEVTVLGKGYKSRVVYLSKLTADMLKKEIKGLDAKDKVFVFFQNQEKRDVPFIKQEDKLYKVIRNLGKRVIGRELHPHCFRHTKLTHMSDLGGDIMKISAYAGHTDVKVSQKYVEISSFVGRNAFKNFSRDIVEEDTL